MFLWFLWHFGTPLYHLHPPPRLLCLLRLPEEMRAVLASRGAAGVRRIPGEGEELQGASLLHPEDL